MRHVRHLLSFRPTLTQRIIIPFVSLLLLMQLIGTLGFGYWMTRGIEEQTWEGLESLAGPLSHDFSSEEDRILLWARTMVSGEAVVDAVRGRDAAALRQALMPMKVSSGLDLVKVVDAQGRALLELSSLPGVDEIDDRKAISQGLSGLFLSDVVTDKSGSRAILVGQAPVKSAAGVIGAVVVGRVVDRAFLNGLMPDEEEAGIAVFGAGKLFASTFEGAEAVVPDFPEVGQRIRTTLKGTPFIGTTLPIKGSDGSSGFSVMVLSDVDGLSELVLKLWLSLAAIFLVGSFLAVLIGRLVSRGISAPIVELSRLAGRFTRGDTSARARIASGDEVGALGQAFNAMVETIDESRQTISRAFGDLDRKHKELMRAHQQLRILLDASSSLTTTLQFQPLLDTIGWVLLSLSDAEASWLLIVDHDLRQIAGHAMLARDKSTGHRLLEALGAKGERDKFPLDGLSNSLSRCVFTRKPVFHAGLQDIDSEHRTAVYGRSLLPFEANRVVAVVPLVADDDVVALVVLAKDNEAEFSEEQESSVRTFANSASLALRNARLFAEVEKSGVTDALTQVSNHRAIYESLGEDISMAGRVGQSVSVMMIDVDNFKLVNDTFGHLTGDRVLQQVARIFRTILRSTDRIGRVGGDEFLLVLPQTDAAQAGLLSERIASGLAAEKIIIGENQAIPISCSIGIATYPQDAATQQELFEKADAAMYRAKRSGGKGIGTANGDADPQAAIDSSWSVLNGLVTAVDNKDHYTREHSDAVTGYAVGLATELGFESESVELLRVAAVLHDVGKLGVPDRILRKPGPLTPEERRIVEQHASFGILLINPVRFPEAILGAIKHHHERYDGRGYPEGLKGEEIPFMARILAVVDAYSAMVTDRPYRKALSLPDAVQELRKHAGAQFDPAIVEAFVRTLGEPASDSSELEGDLAWVGELA